MKRTTALRKRGRRGLAAASLAALSLAAGQGASAQPAPAPGGAFAARAAKPRCVFVNGEHACLRARKRCRPRFRRDYLLGGFECRRRRGKLVLVKASEARLRGDRVVHLQPNGLPRFSTALQAFDKLIADLPGVRQRRGVVGESQSGTTAIGWLLTYRKRLSRGQRRVLDRVLSPPDTASAAQTHPAIGKYQAMLPEARSRLKAHGVPLNHDINIKESKTPHPTTPDADGWTNPTFLSGYGPGNSCDIYFGPSGLADVDTHGRDNLLHELMHCAQSEYLRGDQHFGLIPGWVSDGSANWGAAKVAMEWVGSLGPGLRGWWGRWLANPEVDLFTRTYDAMGFWALLEHQGENPWTLMGPVVQASVGNSSGNSGAAYLAATARTPELVREWGPTHATTLGKSRIWDLNGPGMPRAEWRQGPVRNGTSFALSIQSAGAMSIALDLTADVVQISPSAGVRGYFRPPQGEDVPLSVLAFCVKPGGCTCEGEETDLEPVPTGRALLGYASSPATAGTVRVQGRSLESFCDKVKDTPLEAFRGIAVLDLSESNRGAVLAEFPSGSCRVGRGGFRATARGAGGWTLRASIKAFGGFRLTDVYRVDYRGSDPQFVINGPLGRFSNTYLPAGADPPGSGVMAFGERGRVFGIGMLPVFDRTLKTGAMVLGGMKCRYPRRRPR